MLAGDPKLEPEPEQEPEPEPVLTATQKRKQRAAKLAREQDTPRDQHNSTLMRRMRSDALDQLARDELDRDATRQFAEDRLFHELENNWGGLEKRYGHPACVDSFVELELTIDAATGVLGALPELPAAVAMEGVLLLSRSDPEIQALRRDMALDFSSKESHLLCGALRVVIFFAWYAACQLLSHSPLPFIGVYPSDGNTLNVLSPLVTHINHCAHRASILRSKIDARPWAISINQPCIFYFFLDLARAQRGLFRRCSPQGAPNGPPSSCSAHCRARGGCRPSATAEVWLRRASVRPPA